ncbi:hypothetical protein L6164_023569 [Bauhinia variegata]|uniref:Uncharacterized protein n=1 Tax=Bauhinia variegata TaxID=167791 RepID=A0ACB9MK69_BAUVA|nr:hypothetical protein L6164_023569 [Bauhinia variegata]
MPNIRKFMERPGSKAKVLHKKKSKVGDLSSASMADYFEREPWVSITGYPITSDPVVGQAINVQSNSIPESVVTYVVEPSTHKVDVALGSSPTARPAIFFDPLEEQACLPLSWKRKKTTAQRDRGQFVIVASHLKASSGLDSDFNVGASIDCQRAGSAHASAATGSCGINLVRVSSSAQPSDDRPSVLPLAEEHMTINLDGLKAMAEENAARAKHRVLVVEEKVANAERGLQATLKEVANAGDQTSALEKEMASVRSRLTDVEERSRASDVTIADL